MKHIIMFGRAFGASFALVLLGFVAFSATSPYWQNNTPGVTGPWLGDNYFNIYTIWRAYVTAGGMSYTSGISASQTSGQANCTVLNSDAMQEIKTSASTGYVCLPTAVAGKEVLIGNATGQTIDLYSNATSYVAGTADTINGTAGTTPYTGLSGSNYQVQCDAIANGAWYCAAGH